MAQQKNSSGYGPFGMFTPLTPQQKRQEAEIGLAFRRRLNHLTGGLADAALAGVDTFRSSDRYGDVVQTFVSNLADERERTRTGKPLDRSPVTVPKAPPDMPPLDVALKEAAKHKGDPFWLYRQTHDRGPWDAKSRGGEYEPYGNFLFGAVGTAQGFPRWFLERGSGAYQISKDAWYEATKRDRLKINLSNGVPWGDYPYGDNLDDPPKIEPGIRYAKERGY